MVGRKLLFLMCVLFVAGGVFAQSEPWTIIYEGEASYQSNANEETVLTGRLWVDTFVVPNEPADGDFYAPDDRTTTNVPSSLFRLGDYYIRADVAHTTLLQQFVNQEVEVYAKKYSQGVILYQKGGQSRATAVAGDAIVIGRIRLTNATVTPTARDLRIVNSWIGQYSSFTTATTQVVKDEASWNELYEKINYLWPVDYVLANEGETGAPVDSEVIDPIPSEPYYYYPEIDFSQYMVIAVMMGQQNSYQANITINRVSLGEDGNVTVYVTRTLPYSTGANTGVVINPYYFVQVEKVDGNVTFEYTDNQLPEPQLVISETEIEVAEGQTYYLWAYEDYYGGRGGVDYPYPDDLAMPTDGSTDDFYYPMPPIYSEYNWTSSNESIATVSYGSVVGVSAGECTITVTSSTTGATATCRVKVVPGAPVPERYGTKYIPQVVHNSDSWMCWLVVANFDTYHTSIVSVYGVNGDGSRLGEPRQYSVAPGATAIIKIDDDTFFGSGNLFGTELPASSEPIWLAVYSEYSYNIQYQVVYQGINMENFDDVKIVPLCNPAYELRAPLVLNDDPYESYMTMINPSYRKNTLTFEAIDGVGTSLGTATIVLNPGEQKTWNVTELLPQVLGKTVKMRISSSVYTLVGNMYYRNLTRDTYTILSLENNENVYYYDGPYPAGGFDDTVTRDVPPAPLPGGLDPEPESVPEPMPEPLPEPTPLPPTTVNSWDN